MEARILGSVFGLDIRSDLPLRGVVGAPARDRGEPVVVTHAEAGGDERAVLVEGPPLRIAVAADDSLTFTQDFYGRFSINRSARAIRCTPRSAEPWLWERFLVAQALPAAAALRGLHPIHASAVAIDGEAVLVMGTSGAGKTSTALALLRGGGELLTDDVAALDVSEPVPRVWPGSAQLSVDERTLDSLGVDRWERLGTLEGEERLVAPALAPGSRPVRMVVVLTREAGRERIEVQRDGVQWLGALLGAHFAPWLAEWMGAQSAWFGACQSLAERCELVWLRVPLEGWPAETAAAIRDELARSSRAARG